MLKKTALWNTQKNQGAKFCPYSHWEMPLQFSSMKEEALAVRNSVGMFDACHMGEITLSGPEAGIAAEFLLPNKISSLSVGQAVYSPLLNEEGKIIDDLIVYKLHENQYLLVVNAANIEKDFAWMSKKTEAYAAQWCNISDEMGLIAVQGKDALKYMPEVLSEFDPTTPKFGFQRLRNGMIIARTGYTGEDGYEIIGAIEKMEAIWNKFHDLGVKPCGLGARDLLRIEAGYPLYGNDLSEDLTPLETGLAWTVKMNKEFDFIGKKALLAHPARFQAIKLIVPNAIPRHGMSVFAGEQKVGEVTSGTHSVTLEKGVAMCLVEANLKDQNISYFIEIRGQKIPAQKVKSFLK